MSFVDGADIQKSYQLFGFKDGCARDIPTILQKIQSSCCDAGIAAPFSYLGLDLHGELWDSL